METGYFSNRYTPMRTKVSYSGLPGPTSLPLFWCSILIVILIVIITKMLMTILPYTGQHFTVGKA